MSEQGLLRIEDSGGVLHAPDWAAVASLHRKLHAAMTALVDLDKDGKNQHFGYSYVSYNEAAGAMRAAMTAAGLAFTTNHGEIEQKIDGKSVATTMHIYATFGDTETGAFKTVHWLGESMDMGDKGISKALTNAIKYGLMRTFLTSTDDDAPATGQQRQGQTARATTTGQTVDKATGEIQAPKPTAAPTTPATATAGATTTDAPGASAPAQPETRHPLPAADVPTGQKFNWMLKAFKELDWNTYHQSQWLKKHCAVSMVSELKNGALSEAMQLLLIELNPWMGGQAAKTDEIPF
jgi:cell division septation protein DedD